MEPDLMQEATTQHTEGTMAGTIEEQTAKLPSDTFLWLAIGAMGASAALQFSGSRHLGLFFGQWVPAFLLFGVYNKLVKQLGSDRFERSAMQSSGMSSSYRRDMATDATSF